MLIPTAEILALYQLYNSTQGIGWIWNDHGANWTFSDPNLLVSQYPSLYQALPPYNPCEWEGLACICSNSSTSLPPEYHPFTSVPYYYYVYDDEASNVDASNDDNGASTAHAVCSIEKIYLVQHNLIGTLPPSFGTSFPNLTHVHFARNSLYGSLPTSLLSHFPSSHSWENKLQIIDFCDNSFSGSIPSQVTQLTKLEVFALSQNQLTGSLPSDIGNMRSLTYLYLDENSFEGTVPSSIEKLSNLSVLTINHNHLTGTAPCYLPVSLTSAQLQHNGFTGTIPGSLSLGRLTNLVKLSLSSNHLTSTIPSIWDQLQNLEALHLSSNSLTGVIPSSITVLTKLQVLGLQKNLLTGTIPSYIFSFTNLRYLSMSGNLFDEGPMPNGVSQLTNAEVLRFTDMQFTGSIPSFLSTLEKLQYLYLDSNSFTSTIPSIFGLFSNLTYVGLGYNSLSGSIPSVFESCQKLGTLDLINNRLSGSIPSQLSTLPILKTLLLQNNNLSGSLPSGFVDPAVQGQLTTIDISYNQITGTIPTTIFDLPSLQVFAASVNCLNRTFPPQICNAMGLMELILDGVQSAPSCRGPSTFSIGGIYVSPSYEITSGKVNSDDVPSGEVIPYCIFSMPNLESLHMSGNILHTSLDGIGELGPKLTNLSLSYNVLTGTIPHIIQDRSTWQLLDLSSNRLGGTLSPTLNLSINAELFLRVNRLSGPIPDGIVPLLNIEILQGNRFACPNREVTAANLLDSLPLHDPYRGEFRCGSDEVFVAFFAWLSTLGFTLLLACCIIIMLRRWNAQGQPGNDKSIWKRFEDWRVSLANYIKVFDASYVEPQRTVMDSIATSMQDVDKYLLGDHVPIIKFGIFLRILRWKLLWIAAIATFILIPIYSGVSSYFSDYTYKYIYVISAAFISNGWVAVGFVFLFAFLTIIVYLILRSDATNDLNEESVAPVVPLLYFKCFESWWPTGLVTSTDILWINKWYKVKRSEVAERANIVKSSESSNIVHISGKTFETRIPMPRIKIFKTYSKLIAISILNIAAVLLINILFVIEIISASASTVLILSFFMSIYKLGWTRYVVPWLTSLSKSGSKSAKKSKLALRDKDSRNVLLQSVIALLNIIVIPCLATMAISPYCFYDVFVLPRSIYSSYNYDLCGTFNSPKHGNSIRSSGAIICAENNTVTPSFEFQPPFIYSYQCSSSLLTSYASVYIYFFLLETFGMPLLLAGLFHLSQHLYNAQGKSRLSIIITGLLPRSLRPFDAAMSDKTYMQTIRDSMAPASMLVESPKSYGSATSSIHSLDFRDSAYPKPVATFNPMEVGVHGDSSSEPAVSRDDPSLQEISHRQENSTHMSAATQYNNPIFEKRMFIISLIQTISITATFGLIFPLLAILGCISVLCKTMTHQVILGRFYSIAKERKLEGLAVQLSDECDHVNALFMHTIWIIFPFMCLFFGFFLFDVSGDEFGIEYSRGPAIAIFFFPIVIYGIHVAFQRYDCSSFDCGCFQGNSKTRNRDTNGEPSTDVAAVEMRPSFGVDVEDDDTGYRETASSISSMQSGNFNVDLGDAGEEWAQAVRESMANTNTIMSRYN